MQRDGNVVWRDVGAISSATSCRRYEVKGWGEFFCDRFWGLGAKDNVGVVGMSWGWVAGKGGREERRNGGQGSSDWYAQHTLPDWAAGWWVLGGVTG